MDEIVKFIETVQFNDSYWVLLLPCTLMALDILTGVTHAWVSGHLKSYRMREGLGRKCGEIVILIIGHILTTALAIPIVLIVGASLYICFMELVSICENLDKLGVPIPKFVKRALGHVKDILQEKDGDDENESDDKSKSDEKSE